MSGLRRDESPSRATSPIIGRDIRGLVKINPIAGWTYDDVAGYIRDHDVPYNPLLDQGYPSIGCAPCTKPVAPGEDPRSGRWAGHDRTECGIH
jgi:phosphoadenosine phosphosulfate reductase